MFRILVGRSLAPLCAILLLTSGPAALHAEKKDKGGEGTPAPADDKDAVIKLPPVGRYEALVQEEGLEEPKTFNLAKPEDRRKLAELLHENRIKELSEDEGGPKLMKLQTDLGLWTLVVFLIVLGLLYKLAWGPMLAGLKKREESIAGALEASHKAHEEAKQMQLKLEKQMAEANQQVGALMEETRKAAARTQEEMLAKAQKDIAAERERLRRELDQARNQALQDLSSHAAKLATDVAARVLQRELNVADQHRLVEEALGEMQQAAADRNRVLTEA